MSGSTLFCFFNYTATSEIYTLSLHDALPICGGEPEAADHLRQYRMRENHLAVGTREALAGEHVVVLRARDRRRLLLDEDRKSTRLNSSHANISYAVFCLKQKKPLNSIASAVS